MKNLLTILLFLFVVKGLRAQTDSTLVLGKGWLVYWKDAVIWIPATINEKVRNKYFFLNSEYNKGLLVNYIPDALRYKSISKGYSTHVSSKGYDAIDSIWLMPVIVKYKQYYKEDAESTVLKFVMNEDTVSIEFRGNAEYDIRHLELLRKCDKRKLKRIKNYAVYPPH